MKFLIHALLSVLVSTSAYSKTQKSLEKSYAIAVKKCAEASYQNSCREIFDQLFKAHKYNQAYEIGLIGCAVSVKSCESAYAAAPNTKSKNADSLLKLLKKKCETKSDYCDSLVSIYKEKKQYKSAIEIAKSNFKRTGSIQYPLLLQELKKDQKLIEKVSYQSCTKNTKNCDMVLRYFSTPKNQDKVAARVQKECESQDASKGGADYCSIVGTYYFKNGDVQKALKIWSQSCSYNELTCLLILGSNRADRIIEIDAFNSFCKEKSISEATAEQLRKKHCLIGVSEVPDQIKDHGKKLLQSFVMQQR